MINIFHKNYPKKLVVTFPFINFVLSIVRLLVNLAKALKYKYDHFLKTSKNNLENHEIDSRSLSLKKDQN